MSIDNLHPKKSFNNLFQNLIPKDTDINQTIDSQHDANSLNQAYPHFKRFKIPPDLNLCELHQRATSFGFHSQTSFQRCPCCHQYVKQEVPYSKASDKNIYKINEPVGYYFTVIKMMLLALLFIVVFPGIYSLVEIEDGCEKNKIECSYIYGIPFPEMSAFYTIVSLSLNAGIMIIVYIIVGFLFYWNVLIHQKIMFSNHKASDEHCLISGVNHEAISQEQLKHFLGDFQIEEIIYIYKIKTILKLMTKRTKLQALKKKYQKLGRERKVHKITSQIRRIDEKLIPIKNKFELGQEKQMRTDKIIIKFKNKIQKIRFQNVYKKGFFSTIYSTICHKSRLVVNDCLLHVQILGDPRELIWQNFQTSSKKRYRNIFLNNLAMLLILGVSFYLIVILSFSQQNYHENEQAYLSIIFSVIILVVNASLGFFINFSTVLEGRYTLTGQSQIKIIKKSIAYFLNTTLIPFSLMIIESTRPNGSNADLIRNIITLFLMCNIVSPIISEYLQVSYLIKLFKRYKIKKQAQKSMETQISANQVFQKINFNLEDRYGFMFQRLTNCFFYAGIFPVGGFITAIGLIITYFVSKNQLIKLCSIPKHSFRIGILITQMAAVLPFIYSLGFVLNLYTYNDDPSSESLYSILLVCFSFPVSLIFIFKGHQIAKKYVSSQDVQRSTIGNIDEVGYKDLNPATFLLGGHGSDGKSGHMLNNMMMFAVFRQAVNVERVSRIMLKSSFRDFEEQYNQSN